MARNYTLLTILRLSMAAIFAAWACVWILKPTRLWTRSWHDAEDAARTTLLGDTGLNVVVFCLPVLAVATLGFIYLHLCTKGGGRIRQRKPLIANLSNSIIVDSPIGILSGSELLVAALFVIFLAWTYYSNIADDFKKMTPVKNLQLNRRQLKVMRMGVRLGSLSEACLALLILPVLRGMGLFRIFGVQFEASVRYHVWIGNGMILFSILHGMTIMFVWGAKNSFWKEITKWQSVGRVNLAGGITLVVGLIIWITSLPPIRRKQFQLFYSAHHLYTVFILFFLLHGGDRHFYLVCSGVLLFALDKILRIIQSRQTTHVISAQILQCKAVELTLPKHPSMKYTPTSMIFLNVPSISKFQWHPFSITSSTNVDDDRFSVLIKCHGQWTDSLYNLIHSMLGSGSNQMKSLPIAVEGPYGPANFPYHRYDSLVLVAGGSGITPFLSIIQDIASRNGNMNTHPTKIQLIYMVKRSQDLSLLTPISSLLLNIPAELEHLKLKMFVTQEEGSCVTAREILQEMSQVKTIILDPTSSVDGLPIPEGLLWKAAITGLSSLIFLASLVCLSHVFVHQGKKSSENKIPSWVNDLLVICSFLIATSCITVATVLLRWRKSVNEVSPKQAKAAEMHSVKVQGAPEEYEINFGKRPNLTDLLSELANKTVDSNVGVFVCGPDSMQRSAASFCRTHCRKFKGNDQRQKCIFSFHLINFSL